MLKPIRSFLLYPLCLMLFLASGVQAQSAPHIAVLVSSATPVTEDVLNGFRRSFEQQGVKAEFGIHPLKNSPGEAHKIVTQLREIKPDLVLALGTLALKSAGEQLAGIPIVAGMVINKTDFKNYANVTGVSLEFPVEEHIVWLQKLLPDARTIGVIYSSDENRVRMNNADKILKRKGLTLQQEQISEPKKITRALKRLKNNTDLFWGISDGMVLNAKTAQNILLFSLRNKIPFIGLSNAWVKAGAIYALERDYFDIGQQCAEMATQLLAGKKINKISPRTPRKTLYSLNLKIAERLKIDFSRAVIDNAEMIYGSSAESMEVFRFWQLAKFMI